MSEFILKLKDWFGGLPHLLTGGLSAVLILAIGVILIKLGRKLLDKLFGAYESAHPGVQQGRTVKSLITSLFNVIMYFTVGIMVLTALGIDVSSLLTVAGVSGVAIGFGCQTLVKDYISGMFLWFEGSCNVGDVVTVAGQTGSIEKVSLRTTTLRSVNGSVFVIPNGEIRTVVNMSADYRSAVVDITVAHGQDYEKALEVLRAAMAVVNGEFDFIDEDPKVQGYISMDGRAATARIECRCGVEKCWELERGIRLRALEAFRREGIKP